MINRRKQRLIDEICEHNRTAEPAFLDNFDLMALEGYLDRLTRIHGHRGPTSRWVRVGDTPAIIDNDG